MSTSDLVKLFKVAVNLEELNLSVYSFADLEVIEVPDTLEKLHLEIDFHQLKSNHDKKSLHQPNFDMLSKLLDNFRNNLKYLGLIVLNAEEEFSTFDKFHSLVNNFDHLETFEYDIRTKHRPDQGFPNAEELISPDSIYSAYTNPRPQSFDTSFHIVRFHKYELTSHLTRSQLLIATSLDANGFHFDINLPTSFELSEDLKLINLNKIQIGKCTVDTNSEISSFLSKVIALSPNLHSLILQGGNIEDILLLLKQFITSTNISRKIFHAEWNVHSLFNDQDLAFFSDVSHIVPNLKSLTLRLPYSFHIGISDKIKEAY
jgi:hypothetical protein